MPYASDKQRRYFNANRAKLEAQGVDVNEWNQSSKGKKLPETAPTKESQMKRTEAITKMAAYIRYLAGKIPTGTKAAQVAGQQKKASYLMNLADSLEYHGNLVTAVKTAAHYANQSPAYQHRVVQGLVSGLAKKIAEAKTIKAAQAKQAADKGHVTLKAGRNLTITQQKAGMNLGMSKHPSAAMPATTAPAIPGGVQTTSPMSKATPMKTATKGPQRAGKGKQANVGAGVEAGAKQVGQGVQQAMQPLYDPKQQAALQALLATMGVGGAAGMGATIGGAGGSVAGAERGNTAEGLGRGIIRGGATGAGAGLGALGGNALASQLGQDGALGGVLGAGAGGLAGYLGSGALLGQPQGG
jgi:hypothetical protein